MPLLKRTLASLGRSSAFIVRRILTKSKFADASKMFVVAAEFLGASTGLGFLLIDGQQLGKPAQIVAAIVAFAILGKATDWLIVLVSSPFLRWEDRFART